MNTLEELREWMRIDGDELTLTSLLIASRMTIKKTTGVIPKDVEGNEEATALYKLIQKMIVTDNYENRLGSNNSQLIIGYSSQLQSFKIVGE